MSVLKSFAGGSAAGVIFGSLQAAEAGFSDAAGIGIMVGMAVAFSVAVSCKPALNAREAYERQGEMKIGSVLAGVFSGVAATGGLIHALHAEPKISSAMGLDTPARVLVLEETAKRDIMSMTSLPSRLPL